MTGHPSPVRVGLAFTAGLALLSGCTSSGSRPAPIHRDPGVPALKLVAFDNCAELLNGLRAAAKESVGPYGFPNSGIVPLAADGANAAQAGPEARNAQPQDAKVPEHSGTNAHEASADEPDLVKTDGRRIVTISRGVLRVVDPATRKVTGSLTLDSEAANGNLLLAGDHALVLTSTFRGRPLRPDAKIMPTDSTSARLLLVDLTGTPREIGRYEFDGSLVDARQVGSVARVVVKSVPDLPFPMEGSASDEARIALNRKTIDEAPIERWLPRYTVGSGSSARTGQVDCRGVSRPSTYSGSSLLTVLTFDLNRSTLDKGDPASLVADGETVYANGPSLYVATDDKWHGWPQPWLRQAPRVADQRTDVYKFDISGTGRPRYVAGGSVPGWLINQYAMSEWDGKLRIATTVGQAWNNAARSESTVYVLGSSLEQLGKVGGLGRGERIYAVRFLGPVGYVVTFRQVDPLYTVDLRDPAHPQVTGELKINGYSAYLHPAPDGKLIGVGAEADNNGRRTGIQVSLFDVKDPAHASRIAQYQVPGGYSEAEFDPHAFLYWPATGLLVVPVTKPGGDPTTQAGLAGALALRVSGTTIAGIGTLDQQHGAPIQRSMVIGDALWTLSESTLAAHTLSTLAPLAEVSLA